MFDLYPYLNYPLIVTQDDSLGLIRIPYLVFNSLECAVWLGCAGYLAARTWRHRRQRASAAATKCGMRWPSCSSA
jgi:hypothetical protein